MLLGLLLTMFVCGLLLLLRLRLRLLRVEGGVVGGAGLLGLQLLLPLVLGEGHLVGRSVGTGAVVTLMGAHRPLAGG
jgi:hypothetical protein